MNIKIGSRCYRNENTIRVTSTSVVQSPNWKYCLCKDCHALRNTRPEFHRKGCGCERCREEK